MNLFSGIELECQALSCNLTIQFKLTCGNCQVPSTLLKHEDEKLNIKDDKYTLSFRLYQSHPFMAYVSLSYLLLFCLYNGTLIITTSLITYEHCMLHICVNLMRDFPLCAVNAMG